MNTVKKINLEAIPLVNENAHAICARAMAPGSSKRSGSNFRSPSMAKKHRRHRESAKHARFWAYRDNDPAYFLKDPRARCHVVHQNEHSVQYSDGTIHYWRR